MHGIVGAYQFTALLPMLGLATALLPRLKPISKADPDTLWPRQEEELLELRPNCECCNRDLAPDAAGAFICTFECTFCEECASKRFDCLCPNCSGGLVKRPVRPTTLLGRRPGSAVRVLKSHAACVDS